MNSFVSREVPLVTFRLFSCGLVASTVGFDC